MLEGIWSDPTFKVAIGQVLALDVSLLERVAEVEFGRPRETAPQLIEAGVPDPVVAEVGSVVTFMRRRFGDQPSEIVDELLELAREDGAPEDTLARDKRDALVRLFTFTEQQREELRLKDAQSALYPTLMESFGSVEARMMPYSEQGDDLGPFVPVATLRLQFDEAVSSGSSAVVFNLTRNSLLELKEDVDRLVELFDRVAQRFGAPD